MVNGFPELAMTVSRLPVFYKQRDYYFYPAWAYAIPSAILKIPISLVESLVWTSITYYVIGYSPEAVRNVLPVGLLPCSGLVAIANSVLVVIELPYVLIEVVLFMVVAYPAIGYYWTVYKFFWFFYTMFCTLLYFIYLGMLLVSLTPNVQVASILASVCYTQFNLFSGFIVPSPVSPAFTFLSVHKRLDILN
ncbi:hypothetical protein BHM03_00016103 [Ensete ventricosum]|nr:hypothetical protein BHM03_00016103 [Ensete ventricosum]